MNNVLVWHLYHVPLVQFCRTLDHAERDCCTIICDAPTTLCGFRINWTTRYKLACHFLLPVGHIWLPQRLSSISCFHRKLPSEKINSFMQRLSAWVCFLPQSRQEVESRGQFLQEVIYHGHQSPQEARDGGRSRLKPTMMMVSLGRKRKLAD